MIKSLFNYNKLILSFLLVCGFFIFANQTYAQASTNTLTGKVYDASNQNQAVEFANVAIITPGDSSLVTGGITTQTGQFTIKGIPYGDYLVRVDFIGYKTSFIGPVELKAPKVTLPEVYLNVDAFLLESAEIIAERDFMMSNIDRKTFRTSELIVSEGGTATEIMENIPSVEFDVDGNMSLRGSGNVRVLIDGRPTMLSGGDQESILQQIPASSIDRVEIITNPSAKYEAEGMSGIINIITKKTALGGFTGNVNIGAGTNNRYNLNADINYLRNKWNLIASAGINYRETERNTRSLRINNSGEGIPVLDQESNGVDADLGYQLKFGADYKIDDNTTIYANVSGNTSTEDETMLYSNQSRNFNGDILDWYYRDANAIEDEYSLNANAGFLKQFKDSKKEFALDFSHGYEEEKSVSVFTLSPYNSDFPLDPVLENNRNSVNEGNGLSRGKFDFVLPINESILIETGALASYEELETSQLFDTAPVGSESNWNPENNASNTFKYTESIQALYANYRHALGDFGFQAGLRLENTVTNSRLLNTNEHFKNEYLELFPNAFVTYRLPADQQVKASYSRRISRPNSWSINPFNNYRDPFNIRTGNPFLLPEFTHSAELEYSKKFNSNSFTVAVYQRYTVNMIQRVRVLEGDITYNTFNNFGESQSTGAEASLNARLFKGFMLILSANVNQNKIISNNEDVFLVNRTTLGGFGRGMVSYKFGNGWSLQSSTFYRPETKTAQGKFKSITATDLAVKKTIFKGKGSVSVRVSDIFNTRQFEMETYGEEFTQTSLYKRQSRIGFINFSYRFGDLNNNNNRDKDGNKQSGGGEMDEMDMD